MFVEVEILRYRECQGEQVQTAHREVWFRARQINATQVRSGHEVGTVTALMDEDEHGKPFVVQRFR